MNALLVSISIFVLVVAIGGILALNHSENRSDFERAMEKHLEQLQATDQEPDKEGGENE